MTKRLSCCGCASGISSNRPAAYWLTPAAESDLEDIWRYTAETWSIGQADRSIGGLVKSFALIATMPEMARERAEFDPPVRIHLQDRHLIVYLIEETGIAIQRVLGGRQDWLAILNASEP